VTRSLAQTAPAPTGIPSEWWLRLGHDLRGPVAPMRMAVQMLRGGWVTPTDQEEALQLIDRQMDLLLGSIDDIAELLRIQAGTFACRPVAGDLGALFELLEGQGALKRWLADRQRMLSLSPWPVPVLAMHDPQRLLPVLDFLVRKAAEHSAKGSTIVLSLRAEGGRALWCVSGSGPTLGQDADVRLVTGASEEFGESEARTVLVREIARRHPLAFLPPTAGGLCFSLPALS
jgi:signal transduction histidine kinase